MRRKPKVSIQLLALALLALAVSALPGNAGAHTVVTPFDEEYILVDLGPVPNVPPGYGGVSPYPFDPQKFLLAGAAETAEGALYLSEVARDANGHVTGFTQSWLWASAPGFADGPSHTVFLSTLAVEIAQVTTRGDRRSAPLEPFLTGPLGGIAFVPEGQGGAGQLKFATRTEGQWGTIDIEPDGMGLGTYRVVGASIEAALGENAAGVAYVPQGAPAFPNASVLVTEPVAQKIATYDVDENGDPISTTREEVVLDFPSPMGVTRDPVTGDFLLTSFAGRVFLLRPPPPPTPAVCAPAPLAGCAAPGKAIVSLQANPRDQRKRKASWRWLLGSASSNAFGDPIEDGTNYRLCIYDDDVLRLGLAVPAGETCDGKPCWKSSGSSLRYRSKEGNDDGVTQLDLRPGLAGASIRFAVKGPRLATPFPISDTASVTVQLVKNPEAGTECWGTRFPTPATKHDPLKDQFVDHVP